MSKKPAGHGYSEMEIDRPNPFFETGAVIRGHEFHYSSPAKITEKTESCMSVRTGVGIGGGRDGLVYKNSLAAFMHIHADGVKGWAAAFVKRALEFKKNCGNLVTGSLRAAV